MVGGTFKRQFGKYLKAANTVQTVKNFDEAYLSNPHEMLHLWFKWLADYRWIIQSNVSWLPIWEPISQKVTESAGNLKPVRGDSPSAPVLTADTRKCSASPSACDRVRTTSISQFRSESAKEPSSPVGCVSDSRRTTVRSSYAYSIPGSFFRQSGSK